MNLSNRQSYRAMADALRDLAERRPDRREELRGLAGPCELLAARMECDNSPEFEFCGDAA